MAKNEKLAKIKAKKAAKATEQKPEVIDATVKASKKELEKIDNLQLPEKKKIDKKQVETTNKVVEVTTHRQMKWKFPEGMEDTLDRKKFRQKMRNQIRDMQSKLLSDPENEKLRKELAAIREEVLLDPTEAI